MGKEKGTVERNKYRDIELPTNLPNIYTTTQNNTQDFWNIYAILGFTTEIWDATPL